MKKAINSPFRYAGGKFYARNLILQHVLEHQVYIELFAGGGSIFFAKQKAEENWLNDIDPELINCFKAIRDNPKELADALDGVKATKEKHYYYKNEYEPKNDLERAIRWYYLNRTSYSGIMNMKNCYFGYGDKFSMQPKNWRRNIERTSAKLQGVKLTCLDFEEFIKSVSIVFNKDVFMFIDPPYYNADQDKFYTYSFKLDDHLRLARLLKEMNEEINFMITYDNIKEVRELYRWALEIYDREWNYCINRTDDQKNGVQRKGVRYKGKEVFILNYKYSKNGMQLSAF